LHLLEGEAELLVPGLAAGAPRQRLVLNRRTPATDVEQLPLFGAALPHQVVDRLRGVDVNAMTPIAALQLLAELTELVKQA
jgi:hypothetical protein